MPEPIQPQSQPGDNTPANPVQPDQTPTQTDISKLSGEELSKVLENPELWKQPRIAELLNHSKELKKLQEDQAKREEESLTEQKKFEELTNKRGEQLTQAETQIKNMRMDQALTNALVKESIVDLDAALKLIDRSKLTVDEQGSVQGVDEAVKSLKGDKQYLFTPGNKTIGAPTGGGENPSGTPAKFKRSQIKNHAFYMANREEILKAQAAGLIENDVD